MAAPATSLAPWLGSLEEHVFVRFAFQPLAVPHVVRVDSDGEGVLFVRFSAPVSGTDVIAVPPMLEKEVALKLSEARREGSKIHRVVIVGADPLLAGASAQGGDPTKAEGWLAAMEALGSLFGTLTKERVFFTWRTRGGLSGTIPAALSRALLDAGHLATVEIGLPSLDVDLCRELEGGHAATPDERLRLAAAASARNVSVRALLDPLIPMVNDQRAALDRLLSALADAGVHRLSARYLVMTQERARSLSRRLSKMYRALVQGIFADQPWLPGDRAQTGAAHGPHKLLPPTLRRRGHQRLVDAAARVGIVVDVLDPVAVQGSTDEGAEGDSGESAKPKGRRQARRARPQLDLFRARR